jgi:hypothetical protein
MHLLQKKKGLLHLFALLCFCLRPWKNDRPEREVKVKYKFSKKKKKKRKINEHWTEVIFKYGSLTPEKEGHRKPGGRPNIRGN